MISGSTPIFAASDIQKTLDYYKDVLGFETSWTWGDPPTFGSVSWGNVSMMFGLQPDLAAKVQGHQHWFKTEEVDALYDRHRERGAKVVSPIEDKPWDVREYVVEDLNGYHLRFAGPPSGEIKPSSDFPQGVQLVRRVPTGDEFSRVAGKEFYKDSIPSGILERTWGGVVALSPEGEAIGTVRIMYDSPGWFSVWDVAVLPEWQGRRIGAAIMKEAIEAVHDESPGAFVFLFTFKAGFYERLGFEEGTVTIRKV
ncbi:MAG: GNAT family N-acetyltransferase [Chlorobia bacterium]|nr:GNAT family N-acetyltransferase [Fimbriimonadaceae bacterium]